MASSVERLLFYRLYYHELCVAQSQIPPGELSSPKARLTHAELRLLEEIIMLFVDINPNTTTTTKTNDISNNGKETTDIDVLDVSLVTNVLLLSPLSPWILYVVDVCNEWQLCYVSPSVKRLLGWRPSDMVGKPIWEDCYQEDVQVLQQIFSPKEIKSSSSSRSWWMTRSHAFGDHVSFRRLRRDQSIASMHGTGIAIGSRWYAWVEQENISPILELEGSTKEKSCNRKPFQPPTIVVGERMKEVKVEEETRRMGSMREIKTTTVIKPSSQPTMARSKEIKNWKASVGPFSRSSRHSSVESLPAHIDMSPRDLSKKSQKFNVVNDKGLQLIRGKSVLLVDDSNTYLKGGQALLAKMGCRVFLAHDGEEALQMMQNISPILDLPPQFDLIFMDLSMPKMDGIQAVKLFRNWEGNQQCEKARTLIIAVTANDTDGGMVLCAQTGFDGFVTKPLTKKKILDCLAASTP